ncbi:MAG: SH3 domain-containing protein [Clostridiaceae bacterium]|nr:SH3 domain-containing protein [Clostridiaceae bacterium]
MTDKQEDKFSPQKIEIKRGITPDQLEPEPLSKKKKRSKPVFLISRKRRVPSWLIAILVFTLLMAGLFFIVPQISERSFEFDITPPVEETLPDGWDHYLHDEDTAVVSVAAAPVFSEPDATSTRVAEALLNEHVTMLDAGGRAFIQVRLDDGVTGYVRRSHLVADTDSISPEGSVARIIVRVQFKRVMSHARSGSLVVEAPMGTVLYADYRNGDLLRVKLPGLKTGWINATGVMLVSPLAALVPEDNIQQLLVVTMMAFHNSPVMPGGLTARGISLEGALHVAGLLNGLSLSRDRYVLFEQGRPVELEENGEGVPDLKSMEEGDIIFFHSKTGQDTLASLAMRVADAQLLIDLAGKPTLRLIAIDSTEALELAGRVAGVRRYAPEA